MVRVTMKKSFVLRRLLQKDKSNIEKEKENYRKQNKTRDKQTKFFPTVFSFHFSFQTSVE